MSEIALVHDTTLDARQTQLDVTGHAFLDQGAKLLLQSKGRNVAATYVRRLLSDIEADTLEAMPPRGTA